MLFRSKRHNKPGSVKSTKDIMKTLKTRSGQKNHEIPLVSAIEFPAKEIKIDPYFLGAMLGDGCIHNKASLSFCTADLEVIDRISKTLPSGYEIKHNGRYDYRISRTKPCSFKNNLKEEFNKLGLVGSKSHDKFIPFSYKWNSTEVRLAVLRGIMDTDGYVVKHPSGKSRIGFSSTSKQLAEDVVFLVESLGGICHQRIKEPSKTIRYINGKPIHARHRSYVLDIVIPNYNPFLLSRKAELANNRCRAFKAISKIEYIEEKECICISVSSKNKLYITNNFIVTHNTFKDAFVILDEGQNTTISQMNLFLTRIGKNSKMIITGDPSQSDIGKHNGFNDALIRLKNIPGLAFAHLDADSVVRHPIIKDISERYSEK